MRRASRPSAFLVNMFDGGDLHGAGARAPPPLSWSSVLARLDPIVEMERRNLGGSGQPSPANRVYEQGCANQVFMAVSGLVGMDACARLPQVGAGQRRLI